MALYIGTNYHPHDWPEERWETDFRLMKEAGFSAVRLGHLCWDSYEPEDGIYTFEWFDKVMNLCEKYSIHVILDVSMHPAPIWVHKKCPGCNIGGKNGEHQAPLHRYMDDVADPDYRHFALRFAETLVKRYKDHPALFAFGLCNELGSGYPSYSEESRIRFINWLKKKYGTIEKLNQCWGTRRWSRRYSCFEDIALQQNEIGIGASEAWLDMRRFFSDGISDFITLLKKTVEKNAPGIPHSSNHYAELDTLGFDLQKTWKDFVDYPGMGYYPGYNLRSDLSFAVNTEWYMGRIAETGKPIWCLEFVTGGFGIHSSYYGINRMYMFWSLLHRTQMILGWTWRTMLNGEEQYLHGMLNHDGRPNQNYREYMQTAADFKKLEKYGFPYVPKPEVALAVNYDSKWIAQYHKRQYHQPYNDMVALAVRALENKNIDYNVVDLRNVQGQYKVLVIPGHIIMDEESAEKIRVFVKNGGTAIMTGYSAMMDEHGAVFGTPRPGRLDDVFGIHIEGFWRTSGLEIPECVEQTITRNPETGHEILNVRAEEDSVSLDVEYFEYIGLDTAHAFMEETTHQICAVSKNQYGKGAAYYTFCEPNDTMIEFLLEKIAKETEINLPPKMPAGIQMRRITENETFYLNLTGKDIEIPLVNSGYGVLGEKQFSDNMILKAYDGELIVS